MTIADCWHGAHSADRPLDPPVPARPGHFTCAEHADIETQCRHAVEELREVQARIDVYSAQPPHSRHPDAAKQEVEGAIRDFFRAAVPDVQVGPGTRAGPAGRDEELDITVTCREEDASRLGHEAYKESRGVPLRAHAEVKHRGVTRWSADLARRDHPFRDRVIARFATS